MDEVFEDTILLIKLLKEGNMGGVYRGVVMGDTRSLDYSSFMRELFCVNSVLFHLASLQSPKYSLLMSSFWLWSV